jgi:archaetidylinositol phosphate synthase
MDVYIPAVMPSPGFRNANRVHEAFTAGVEKRFLIWLAKRTPQWLNSDHLTLLGFFSIVAAGLCFGLSRWNGYLFPLACIFIALNWLGDSLDGTLARVRDQQRPRYGFYIDHIVDCIGSTALVGGLAFSGKMRPEIGLALLIMYLLLMAESFLATYTLGRFHMSRGSFGPTELRILLIIGALRIWHHPNVNLWGQQVQLLDVAGVIASLGMFAMLLATACRHTAELFREEPLP